MSEIVSAPSGVVQESLDLPMRLKRGMLVGDKWHEPGSIVKMGVQCAKVAFRAGAAVCSGPVARVRDWVDGVLEEPKPSAAPASGEYYKLERGSVFFGSKTYTTESGYFQVPSDVAIRFESELSPETQKRLGLDPAKCPVLQRVAKLPGK
jgi:hypothetical protein